MFQSPVICISRFTVSVRFVQALPNVEKRRNGASSVLVVEKRRIGASSVLKGGQIWKAWNLGRLCDEKRWRFGVREGEEADGYPSCKRDSDMATASELKLA